MMVRNFFLYGLFLLSLNACSTWSEPVSTTRAPQNSPNVTIPNNNPISSSTPARDIDPISGSSTPVAQNNVEDFYVVFGRRYAVMKDSTGFSEQGIASWYGDPFHGQKTSNGEIYDMYQMTAAHKHLPLPTFVQVTRPDNGRSVIVRINDRGPFKDERVIDLSYAAAQELDMLGIGTAPVSIRALDDMNESILAQRINAAPVFVQVGSYQEMDNALNSQDLLNSIGISNSRIVKAKNFLQKPLFRLQVGPIATGSEYDELIRQLKTIGIHETIIIRNCC